MLVDLPIEQLEWQIGLVVGPSGTGKTSIGKQLFSGGRIVDLYKDWPADQPIVEAISPGGDFNAVTGSLANVGLGDVPSWLRPFHALSNGQQFRAGLARLISESPEEVIVDEFTSVIDRQIAKIGAMAFGKGWRRNKGKKIVLLSCHYDVVEWLQPDWVYDTGTATFKKKSEVGSRPVINLEIRKVDQSYWKSFKAHYYLDLPMPPAAEYFIGTVDGELVCHLAVCPLFTAHAYRATRLVVMPEWQGAGVGTKFLEWICEYHKEGNGRTNKKFPTLFHTSHPQLISYLKNSSKWVLKSQQLFGSSKAKSRNSLIRSGIKKVYKKGM